MLPKSPNRRKSPTSTSRPKPRERASEVRSPCGGASLRWPPRWELHHARKDRRRVLLEDRRNDQTKNRQNHRKGHEQDEQEKQTHAFVEQPSRDVTDGLPVVVFQTDHQGSKSCTAPIRIEPKTTQSRAGTQPHMMAMAGPTIGPVPAIEVK